MNLKEFINYRQYCPICETQLVMQFHSDRKQTIKVEEHRFLVFFALDGRKAGQKPYGMAYSFDLSVNHFQIEFYTKDRATRFDAAHDFLRNRFLELHKNLKQFRFIRECKFCDMYNYSTAAFNMDLRKATFEPIDVRTEDFGLVQELKEGHRIYRLSNTYPDNKSVLTFWKGKPGDAKVSFPTPRPWQNPTQLNLPLIPFVSKEATIQRLNNLIIFT